MSFWQRYYEESRARLAQRAKPVAEIRCGTCNEKILRGVRCPACIDKSVHASRAERRSHRDLVAAQRAGMSLEAYQRAREKRRLKLQEYRGRPDVRERERVYSRDYQRRKRAARRIAAEVRA